jgi:dephospho-CoA kinase
MSQRLRIGLTGGIASGKSAVAARFAELGVPVVDADVVARAVVRPGTPGHDEVVARFGRGILGENDEIDRRALRDLVFADPAARRDLEALLHPRIRAEMDRLAETATGPYVVLVIPLLIEGGQIDRVDRILVVDAEEALQIRRVAARDGSSTEQARAIIAAQASRASRLGRADDVIRNEGSLPQLRQAVDRLHSRYLDLAAATLP